jgi:hypothetical protein
VRDGGPGGVHDRGKNDVLRIQARLQNRPQPGVGAQRLVLAAGRLRRDHVPRPIVDGVGQQLGARAALLQADTREVAQKEQAQENDDRADDRRHADDLLGFDA